MAGIAPGERGLPVPVQSVEYMHGAHTRTGDGTVSVGTVFSATGKPDGKRA